MSSTNYIISCKSQIRSLIKQCSFRSIQTKKTTAKLNSFCLRHYDNNYVTGSQVSGLMTEARWIHHSLTAHIPCIMLRESQVNKNYFGCQTKNMADNVFLLGSNNVVRQLISSLVKYNMDCMKRLPNLW